MIKLIYYIKAALFVLVIPPTCVLGMLGVLYEKLVEKLSGFIVIQNVRIVS